ncbi:MAG: glycosyltransferase family 9 protein [Pseudomonadota bacterium]|nr:glycosyltransferase family 9 protein [Chloroflexota bacterium]MDP9414327.1 glycosyltransferase family 9 protein [Pseudomonadota bacterium]
MVPSGAIVRDVRKIAVLRSNALGDMIFVLPALEALRAAYPGAEIVLLAKEWHAAFWQDRPGPVDRVIVVPPSIGVNSPPGAAVTENPVELARFFAAMSAERFDLALQLHGGGRYSNPFVQRLGARITAGLKTPDASPLDRWLPYIYFQPEILRYLETVALVGAQPVTLEPRLVLTAADCAEAARVVPHTSRPLVALHPGAGHPTRRWPPEHFAAVADALVAAGADVVVIGTEPERAITEAVMAAMQQPARNLCGQLALGGLAGLLSRCAVFIGNDSGPLHLAGAVGAATVGIFWCANLINAEPLTRTRHHPLLSWQLHCPVCGRNTVHDPCTHPVSLVANVPVNEVVAAARDLLARGTHG